MKKTIALATVLYSLAFSSFSWAAPAAATTESKDAKTLQELNYKYDRLIQLDYARHQELMKQLKEIREIAKKPNAPAELPAATVTVTPVTAAPAEPVAAAPATPTAPTASTAETPAPASEKPVEAPSTTAATPVVAATAEAAPAAEPVAGTTEQATEKNSTPPADKEATGRENVATTPSPSETTTPVAAVTTPTTPAAPVGPEVKEVKMVIPPEVIQGIHESESFAILAILFSVICLGSMGALIYTVRKSDARIRRMLWKSEVDHLRDEVMGGRPMLKVEKNYDRLLLTNTGTVEADEIKLSLGPAPATMKQRLRVLTKIAAGEKAEVEIGAQSDGQIYGTLEYKNSENDRSYKEQFTLKVDGVTGELTPIQQAS